MHFLVDFPPAVSAVALLTAASQAARHFVRSEEDDERNFWSALEATLSYAATLQEQRLEVGTLIVADGCEADRATVFARRALYASPMGEESVTFLVWHAVLSGALARLATYEGYKGIEEELEA